MASGSSNDDNGATLRPTQIPYSVATFSGYTSATSSLPGSGAVTPRTPGFVAEANERTALLDEGQRDLGTAEEGVQGSQGGKFLPEVSDLATMGSRSLSGRMRVGILWLEKC